MLFSLLFDIPGENQMNGKKENHNPLDDISSDLFKWGEKVRPRCQKFVFGEKNAVD
jgi:hypothetical protein